ncbi:hypothetical protein CSV80_13690 [Sporosarcina sp. P12(2017)]|uniref:hypothetical protein n=1 Tax=unclassified Sporosarcina TaxID=2647733 RepID=UPI000C16408A|nr:MULTISPECIES: hypothetical protein [unclassified Sporosarcina]PIC56721.1 hypothetical protein CSV81_13125 [Sporosarcina sp. P10]PIC59938.1 hypothetical protein CSV80_13690 [Sporosarcina sp. P12(2017)]
MLESPEDFLKFFPCDLRGDIKYPINIGIEDCKQFCEEVLCKVFKDSNAYPLNFVTLENENHFEFLKKEIEKLNFSFEIINNHPEEFYILIKIANEEEFLKFCPLINYLALVQSLCLLSTSESNFHIEEGVPKFWSSSNNKVVGTMTEESTFISFENAGLVVLVGTNCSVVATHLKEVDNE